MVGTAVRELCGCNIQNSLSCPLRNHMHKTEQILAGIPESHSPSHAAFKVTGTAAHVERHHALVLIPDIDHPADVLVLAGKRKVGEQTAPEVRQLFPCCEEFFVAVIALLHGNGTFLVDNPAAFPFLIFRILNITEHQDDALCLSGEKIQGELHRTDRCPPVGYAARATAAENCRRLCRAAVDADKSVSRRVEGIRSAVCPQKCIVITPLAVFRFMVDGIGSDFHFTGRKIALEIGSVIHGVPKAEFGIRENINFLFLFPDVGNCYPAEQTGFTTRHQHLLCSQNALLFAFKNRIAQPVAAAIGIDVSLHRLPGDIPDLACRFQVNMEAVLIQRAGIIAVAGNAAQARILIKAVAASRIGDKRKKILAAEIVNPGKRRFWSLNNIFALFVIKISELHKRRASVLF